DTVVIVVFSVVDVQANISRAPGVDLRGNNKKLPKERREICGLAQLSRASACRYTTAERRLID
ncbi:hypothetical protein, partial [Escherichia coli]|uniref:hypothetical protein n=1 Tax=Escherichia coli TaxID=562 RepID=UPI0019544953